MQQPTALYENLIRAYSQENLNHITGQIIGLYKSRNFDQLYGLANGISEYVSIETDKASKCFSGLMMLYHPDRGEMYRRTLSRLMDESKTEELESFSHILRLGNLEGLPVSSVDEDIGYDPEYEWDDSQSGFSYFTESGNEENETRDFEPEFENSFYNIVKIRMYGTLKIELPAHYLEDFEDIEFAESQIDTLDGIDYCKHATGSNQKT